MCHVDNFSQWTSPSNAYTSCSSLHTSRITRWWYFQAYRDIRRAPLPSAVLVPSSSFEPHPICGYDYTGGTTINRNSISSFFLSCSATCSAPSTSVVEEFSTRSFANQAAACTPDLTWWTCTCFAAYPATSLMPSCTVTPTISILFLVSPASSRAPTLALTSSSGHLLVKRSRR